MAPTNFKFTTPEGINRRLSFSEPPTWSLLASKLHTLYGISLDNVGVSYVDNDNDEITLSSDEELQDFYKTSHQADQVIKFAVVDLHASQNNTGKPRSFNRNPFDAEEPFEFIREWDNFPAVLVEDMSKSGPHAFVEVLSSNNSEAHDHIRQMDMDSDGDDDHSTVQPPLSNKGKGRSLSFGAASITSVLEEEMSPKHPIHVYDVNSRKDDKDKDDGFDDPSAHIHVVAQSTPKVQAKNIDNNGETEETTPPSKAAEVEDPPLPSLDESPASATSASLIQDLASLVHDAAQVVSSHPELSEGFRNIGRNISAGTYWTARREAFSDIVNGTSNAPSTEERRQADEAAVMRLTSLIGNFFRTLSQVSVGTEDTRTPDINENRSEQSHDESNAHVSPPWWGSRGMHFRGPRAAGYRPHIPPIFPSHAFHGMPSGPFRPPSFPFHHPVPPPPPPPPHAPASPYPTPSTNDHQTADPSLVQGHIPPPPPPPPPHPSVPSPNGSSTPMPGSHGPSGNSRHESYQGFSPVSGVRSQQSKPSAQEMREQVEAAKRLYKAEKARYRQELEQRRRDKMASKQAMRYNATVGSSPVAQAEIPRENETSSIRFFPEVERVSVPRRSHTHLGHGPIRRQEDLTTRAIARITRKLADMGFSENAYPTLQEKIRVQMPPSGTTISKEAEDDVVTTLLEELLVPTSSKPNVASGSGQRDVDMSEAWH